MTATVNTVTGPLPVEQLGVTLMHEHLVIGFPGWQADTLHPGPARRERIATCVDRIQEMQDLGGHAHWALYRETGTAVERMAELFIHELEHGVGPTGIRPGLIKVGTGAGKITDYEYDVLAAAAMASNATRAPITTHTDAGTMGREQQEYLLSRGVPPARIVIGHSCGNADPAYHRAIAERGSYVGFDRFGLEMLAPDEQRTENLAALIHAGLGERAVVSHDCVFCSRGMPFPPELFARLDPDVVFNPTHFHRHIIPALRRRDVTERQIEQLLVDNPRRYFAGG